MARVISMLVVPGMKHARTHALLVLASWRGRAVHPLSRSARCVDLPVFCLLLRQERASECDDCDVPLQTGKRQQQ